jgi:hypothetical protein
MPEKLGIRQRLINVKNSISFYAEIELIPAPAFKASQPYYPVTLETDTEKEQSV